MARQRSSIVSARYPGTCPRCGEKYGIDTRIAKYDEGWSHVGCPPIRCTVEDVERTARALPASVLMQAWAKRAALLV